MLLIQGAVRGLRAAVSHGLSTGPAGDPVRAAEIIVRVAERDLVPLHLLLGVNAVNMALGDYSSRQLDEAQAWEQVSHSAEPYPAPLPSENASS